VTTKSHRDLDVWKRAMDLAEQVYRLTATFPKDELYGLVSQMRRASVSVASNIAEGAARSSRKEFFHYLHTALGSLAELETQAILANRLDLADEPTVFTSINSIRKMLLGLIRFLKEKKMTDHRTNISLHSCHVSRVTCYGI